MKKINTKSSPIKEGKVCRFRLHLRLPKKRKDPLCRRGGGLEAGGGLGHHVHGMHEHPDIQDEGNNGAEADLSLFCHDGAHDTYGNVAEIAQKLHNGVHDAAEKLALPVVFVQIGRASCRERV